MWAVTRDFGPGIILDALTLRDGAARSRPVGPTDAEAMGREKAVEVSLFSWFRNLWKAEAEGRRNGPPVAEPTVDYPSTSTVPMSEAPAGSAGLVLHYGVVSTVGNVREHNEDNYYVPIRGEVRVGAVAGDGGQSGGARDESDMADSRPVGPPTLFVVADGMGGQLAGEQASSMAVEHIPRELHNRLGDPQSDDEPTTLRAIRDAVSSANQEILSLSSLETGFANMGTTVVLALFRRERVYVAGIGDSRGYRFREGKLEQLTRDHSLADALSEVGTIKKDEVQNHKFKNVLYLYLGSKDARGGPEEVRVMDIRVDDRLLLATDGLTGVVTDDRIGEVLSTLDDPARAARLLVDEALANKSKDNITCVVIHVVGG